MNLKFLRKKQPVSEKSGASEGDMEMGEGSYEEEIMAGATTPSYLTKRRRKMYVRMRMRTERET
jgi:hypothetical protein